MYGKDFTVYYLYEITEIAKKWKRNFFCISSVYGRADAILQCFAVSQTKNSGSLCTA